MATKESVYKIKLDVDDSELKKKLSNTTVKPKTKKQGGDGVGGLSGMLSGGTGGVGSMVKNIGVMTAGVMAGMTILQFISGILSDGLKGVMKLVKGFQKMLSMLVMPFANLLIPLMIPLLRVLTPVVKVLNRIMMPIYRSMMTAMKESGGGMNGFTASLAVGLEGLSRIGKVMFGKLFEQLGRLITDYMVNYIEVFAILIGKMFGAEGATLQFIESLEKARILIKGGLTASFTDMANKLLSTSNETKVASSDMETGLSWVQRGMTQLSEKVFNEQFASDLTKIYENSNTLQEQVDDMAKSKGMESISLLIKNMKDNAEEAVTPLSNMAESVKKVNEALGATTFEGGTGVSQRKKSGIFGPDVSSIDISDRFIRNFELDKVIKSERTLASAGTFERKEGIAKIIDNLVKGIGYSQEILSGRRKLVERQVSVAQMKQMNKQMEGQETSVNIPIIINNPLTDAVINDVLAQVEDKLQRGKTVSGG